ncbi:MULTISPECIES: ATP cone domain-containing protein [unclassified Arsukibacterium]|uniref:ATP cone domain-containing protein n=1 Tax=unclassified Arsukibacterium TaxID=2635278 RepID=UPI000C5FE20C|nr:MULTISPECIES: ATP cone domain-containing protein [unclassified Arsukibacterium]MAA96099.1 hypothetical protein [Rheinheimera sp.]MBM35447.1 hypothetical protein [Rheinheimera sp.]|tara:strand:+ start:2094 stop:2525 length:432 start_codon:yes stop_codon:yes gene_type:complete
MSQRLYVTKRDGRREPLDLDKIHRVITWAAEGLRDVSVSQVPISIFYEDFNEDIEFINDERNIDIAALVKRVEALLFKRLMLPVPICNFIVWVLMPHTGLIFRKLNTHTRTRQRVCWKPLDTRELLRVTSKFARAPPENHSYL